MVVFPQQSPCQKILQSKNLFRPSRNVTDGNVTDGNVKGWAKRGL